MADVIGVPPAETALPRAWLLFRRGAFSPALAANDSARDVGSGVMRAALIGDYGAVFAAFVEMNRLTATPAADAARMRERHGDLIARLVRTTTPRWYDNWTAAAYPHGGRRPSLPSAGDHRSPG
jgi:hypothetical protein